MNANKNITTRPDNTTRLDRDFIFINGIDTSYSIETCHGHSAIVTANGGTHMNAKINEQRDELLSRFYTWLTDNAKPTVKQTAANNPYLRDTKRNWNAKIFKSVSRILNAEGRIAAERYLATFTNKPADDDFRSICATLLREHKEGKTTEQQLNDAIMTAHNASINS